MIGQSRFQCGPLKALEREAGDQSTGAGREIGSGGLRRGRVVSAWRIVDVDGSKSARVDSQSVLRGWYLRAYVDARGDGRRKQGAVEDIHEFGADREVHSLPDLEITADVGVLG